MITPTEFGGLEKKTQKERQVTFIKISAPQGRQILKTSGGDMLLWWE